MPNVDPFRLKVKTTQGGLVLVGHIEAFVDERVTFSPVDKIVLDVDNVLLTKDRLVVGIIEDVFGPVDKPHYSSLLDKYVTTLVSAAKLTIGDPVFCIASEMNALYEDKIRWLKSQKGCDASNKFDEEPAHSQAGIKEDLCFSDDEEEDKFYQKKPKNHTDYGRGESYGFSKGQGPRIPEPPRGHIDYKKAESEAMNQERIQTQSDRQAPQIYTQPIQAQSYVQAQPTYMAPYPGMMYHPMVPQAVPTDHIAAYQYYLAQINMMYGLPPNANNGLFAQHPSYMQPLAQPTPQIPQHLNQVGPTIGGFGTPNHTHQAPQGPNNQHGS